MIRRLIATNRVRAGVAALAVSMLVLAWAVRSAVRVTAVPLEGAVSPRQAVVAMRRADTTSDDLVQDAIEHDPFSPTRAPSDVAYGTPPEPVILNQAPPPVIVLHLVGTVVDPASGSFVVCQLGDATPRVLRVGQRVGVYELESITQGAATFVTHGGERLDLRVPKNGS
jgi:hypothetical protein